MKKIILSLMFISILCIPFVNAQRISVDAHLGWAVPQGKAFSYDENSGGKGGICYTADILYHFAGFEDKLAAGVVYNGALIAGGGKSEGFLNIDLYYLELYGVKGYYRFFKSFVSPYVSLSLGLSHLATPDISGAITIEGHDSFSLGVAPEFGIELGGFNISAMYFTPMKYVTWSEEKQSAGTLQISIGYRYKF
jgi:hypothetical protein